MTSFNQNQENNNHNSDLPEDQNIGESANPQNNASADSKINIDRPKKTSDLGTSVMGNGNLGNNSQNSNSSEKLRIPASTDPQNNVSINIQVNIGNPQGNDYLGTPVWGGISQPIQTHQRSNVLGGIWKQIKKRVERPRNNDHGGTPVWGGTHKN